MNYLPDLLVNIGAAALVAILGGLIYRLREILTNRRLWRIRNAESYLICLPTRGFYTGKSIEVKWPLASVGALRSLAYVAPSLDRAYKNFDAFNIYLSEDQISNKLESNLITIGGPESNRVTRHILSRLDLPIKFDGRIINLQDGDVNKSFDIKTKNRKDSIDYGIILRTANPMNKSHAFILFAGVGTHGTTAATRLFVTEFRKIKYLFLGEFVALVRADIVDGHPGKPKLEKLIKL